jgi:hypothetical protein
LSGLLAVVMLGGLLAARPAGAAAADPTAEAGRVVTLRAVAADADRSLEELALQLQAAIEAGRTGSALIIDGEQDPGPAFEDAAAAARSAADLALTAASDAAHLQGVMAAVAPPLGQLPAGPGADVATIAEQLAATGEVGGPFVERRLAADATLAALGEALEALDRDDPQAALAALEGATESLRTVATWPEPPTVLPFWLRTTGALIKAARAIARATIVQDPAAAAAAARAYQRAAERARRADTALALAISEVGSSLAVTPMRRLADALAAALAQRQAIGAILAGTA